MKRVHYRLGLCVLLVLGLFAATWLPGPRPGAGGYLDTPYVNSVDALAAADMQAATLTFAPNADARADQSNPTTNYGSTTTLRADSDSGAQIQSYVRFSVTGVSGTIQSATLRLYATSDGTPNGPVVNTANSTWSESTITWNNRPALTSGALGNTGAIGTNSWVEYNVAAAVTGNGTFTFALVADSTDGVTFSSRQGSTPPQLVVTLASGSTATPTRTPAGTPTHTPIGTPTRTPTRTPTPPAGSGAVLVGAGDIASCS